MTELPPAARRSPRARLAVAVLLGLLAAALPAAGPGPAHAAGRATNPYGDARVYVNPEWSANAFQVPGGEAVAGEPTAVWLDRIADIPGGSGRMGLRDHLDEALAQDATLVQLVLHDLPGRDCHREVSAGELRPDEIDVYTSEFVDPVIEILADPAYARLRLVTVVEPHALGALITHTSPNPGATPLCDEMRANGNYLAGIGYALQRLATLPNSYAYLDADHHGRLGWADTRDAAVRQLLRAASTGGATPADVHGFITNTADYSVLREEYYTVDDVVNGQPVRDHSSWIAGNDFAEELPYALALREELVAAGFDPGVGMLVDTSRNGWGGPGRPGGPGPGTSAEEYVEGGRLDRRDSHDDWCNVAHAGLGERPAVGPATGIDAFVWAKPPGESDGGNGAGGPFGLCDPDWGWGGPLLPPAPAAGEWYPEYFAQLLVNAWPPLG